MLVLSRKEMESLVISDTIVVQVLGVRGQKVRLGITAPQDVPVQRVASSSVHLVDAPVVQEGRRE